MGIASVGTCADLCPWKHATSSAWQIVGRSSRGSARLCAKWSRRPPGIGCHHRVHTNSSVLSRYRSMRIEIADTRCWRSSIAVSRAGRARIPFPTSLQLPLKLCCRPPNGKGSVGGGGPRVNSPLASPSCAFASTEPPHHRCLYCRRDPKNHQTCFCQRSVRPHGIAFRHTGRTPLNASIGAWSGLDAYYGGP